MLKHEEGPLSIERIKVREYDLYQKRFEEALGPWLGAEYAFSASKYLLSIVYPALEELQMLRDERGSLGREIYRHVEPKPGEELSEALLRLIGSHEDNSKRDTTNSS